MGLRILDLLFLFSNCFFVVKAVDRSDYLVVNQSLSLNDTLVSSRGIFELGFFTPGSSLKEYVGVWYYKDKSTVIWVANRQLPVVKKPGKLILRHNGVLEISDRENMIIWSSSSSETVLKPVGQLLDTGNFVVGDKIQIASDQFIWQGFDYPCNTRVTKMKIGYDKRRKRNVYQSSWKSLDDPAEGEYEFKFDLTGIPQAFITKGFQETLFRTGPWNGETFSGIPHINPDSFFRMTYTDDDEWMYFLLEPISSYILSRTVLEVNGTWLHFNANANADSLDWKNDISFVLDNCDKYNWCGPYASCNIHETQVCECLAGYVPKSSRDWHIANWTEGCVRSIALNCSREDKFYKLSNIKVPDTRNAYGNLSWSLEECKIACLENCSCTAYGNMYVSYGGKGCLLWFGELKDIKVYPGNGQNIFVRGDYPVKGHDVRVVIISSTASALGLVIVMIFIICHRWKKTHEHRQHGNKEEMSQKGNLTETSSSDLDLPLFDNETISRATNNFSAENKLGQGGFGPVYKGILQDGQEVAVKKLSQDSKQGSIEFKNEAMCIAKLQHRNLVKLLGCCIQEECMLIYEFMPNKSLDLFIFDHKERALLIWPMRVNIINGIARGLLYLHQDSRLRIIHRDLKASNVLLDSDMNPKISDFGLARICGGTETAASTTRVVGTYGYMSPEYAIDGLFSVKSDVYSFGVLVLEIISGRGNRGFYHSDHQLNLLGHIWKLFNEERFMEAVDETLMTSYDPFEVTRAIHVGLLCVQESPQDRPTMASVVLMLSSDTKLPAPKAPGFFTARKIVETDSLSINIYSCSENGMSVTMMDPR